MIGKAAKICQKKEDLWRITTMITFLREIRGINHKSKSSITALKATKVYLKFNL